MSRGLKIVMVLLLAPIFGFYALYKLEVSQIPEEHKTPGSVVFISFGQAVSIMPQILDLQAGRAGMEYFLLTMYGDTILLQKRDGVYSGMHVRSNCRRISFTQESSEVKDYLTYGTGILGNDIYFELNKSLATTTESCGINPNHFTKAIDSTFYHAKSNLFMFGYEDKPRIKLKFSKSMYLKLHTTPADQGSLISLYWSESEDDLFSYMDADAIDLGPLQ
jgi:hypothetical protein